MATVSMPMISTVKPSELAWWKVYDEEAHTTTLEQKAYYEKVLMYGKPSSKTSVMLFTVTEPATSPELAREKALAYVHEARAVMGAKRLTKLPRGRVGQGQNCVLARALPYCSSVGGAMVHFKNATVAGKVAEAWATTARGSDVSLPDALRDFVIHFDQQHYEDLIA